MCSDPSRWTVTEERDGYCRAVCGEEEVELDGLLGTCGVFSTSCRLLETLGTRQQRAVRCCYDDERS